MTTPTITTLDEHTEADISHAARCECTTWPDDQHCGRTAEWIVTITVNNEPAAPYLACTPHAETVERHVRQCPACLPWIAVVLERIDRRAG